MSALLLTVQLLSAGGALYFAVVGLSKLRRDWSRGDGGSRLSAETRGRVARAVRRGELPSGDPGFRQAVIRSAERQAGTGWLPAGLGCLALNQLAIATSSGSRVVQVLVGFSVVMAVTGCTAGLVGLAQAREVLASSERCR